MATYVYSKVTELDDALFLYNKPSTNKYYQRNKFANVDKYFNTEWKFAIEVKRKEAQQLCSLFKG